MFTPEFSKQGWLQDVEPYLADKYLTPADFNYPDDFYGVTYSGKYTKELADLYGVPAKGTFGIPWIAGFNVLYYRTDLLEAAGLKGPPFTVEELLKAAQTLNDPAKGIYGFVMSAKRDTTAKATPCMNTANTVRTMTSVRATRVFPDSTAS